jgi:predicted hydrocarbon binding protein
VIWWADATNVLHEFACLCAEDALKAAKVKDPRCWNAISVKLRWIKGEATNEELDAAREAARAAAWAAAREAAREAARAAAGEAAREAARAAAREAQNIRLESMLRSLADTETVK